MEAQNRAKDHAPSKDGAGFEQIVAVLPLVTYHAGETVLTAGSKSGRLLILKKGAVAILKDSIEIAKVEGLRCKILDAMGEQRSNKRVGPDQLGRQRPSSGQSI